MWTDRLTDMTKLVVAFLNSAKGLKKKRYTYLMLSNNSKYYILKFSCYPQNVFGYLLLLLR